MKIDRMLDKLSKKIDNIIDGLSPSSSRWDISSSSGSTPSSNWDMINNAIKDHEDDQWYIPKDNVVNAWTCAITLTVGNIDLRDFELERKFADMRHERVEEYDRKWQEALDNNDNDCLSKHC